MVPKSVDVKTPTSGNRIRHPEHSSLTCIFREKTYMYFIHSDQMEYECQVPRYVIFFHFLRSEDWRGGVRRTAVDALARLFTGEPWGVILDPAGGFSQPN